MWPGFQTAYDRRIGSEVLLHGTPATVLGRGAPLDHAGDRGGPTVGRLLEGVSHERACCWRDIPIADTPWHVEPTGLTSNRSNQRLFGRFRCARLTGLWLDIKEFAANWGEAVIPDIRHAASEAGRDAEWVPFRDYRSCRSECASNPASAGGHRPSGNRRWACSVGKSVKSVVDRNV